MECFSRKLATNLDVNLNIHGLMFCLFRALTQDMFVVSMKEKFVMKEERFNVSFL